MRFLVDENLPVDIARLLEREGHDVIYLRQSPFRGASDEEVSRLAVAEERILVTRDLDFPLPDSPRPPGLVLLRVPDMWKRDQIAHLMSELMIGETFRRIEGVITVVAPGRVRSRKLQDD